MKIKIADFVRRKISSLKNYNVVSYVHISDSPSYDEILLALHNLKNNKAGGIDGLPLELFLPWCPISMPTAAGVLWPDLVTPETPKWLELSCHHPVLWKGRQSEMLQLPWNQLDRHCPEGSWSGHQKLFGTGLNEGCPDKPSQLWEGRRVPGSGLYLTPDWNNDINLAIDWIMQNMVLV